MKDQEETDSIVSDEQSLELDCRRIIPKFKKEDYDTFYTESNTSVLCRIQQIRSNSSDYKFKTVNQVSPISTRNKTYKSVQCTLLSSNDQPAKIGVKLQLEPQLVPKKQKASRKTLSPLENFAKCSQQLPQIQQIQFIEQRNQCSPNKRKGKRQFSHTYDPHKVEASPLKITRFSTRQIRVKQLVNTCYEPLQEKLSLVSLKNIERDRNTRDYYTQQQISLQKSLTPTKPKSILKSNSVSSEGSIGKNSARAKAGSKKSSFFKKVTFDTIVEQKQARQSRHQIRLPQQLIIIQ